MSRMAGEHASERENWVRNDEGALVPRRTAGSVADGFTHDDFALVCQTCGFDFTAHPDMTVWALGQHFAARHHTSKATTELVWLGVGPCPATRRV